MAELNYYLERLLRMSSRSANLCEILQKIGLKLPSRHLMSFSKMSKTFEFERINENIGSLILRGKVEQYFGYKSSLVESVINSTKIVRSDLWDLSRSSDVDAKINENEWLLQYSREALCSQRSSEHLKLVHEEKFAEIESIGISHILESLGLDEKPSLLMKKDIVNIINNVFKKIGYAKSNKKSEHVDFIFEPNNIVSGLQINFGLSVQAAYGYEAPVSIRVYILPNQSLNALMAGNSISIAPDKLIKPIWPIVPNFGLYISSFNIDETLLSLFAYKCLLAYLITLLSMPDEYGLLDNS